MNAHYDHTDIAAQIASRRMLAEAQEVERKDGFKSTYIKLGAGKNTLRFLPSPEGEPLIIEFRQHAWQQPKFSTGLDLEWLFRNENAMILSIAQRLGKVNDRDADLYTQYGDPITAIARNGLKAGISKDDVSDFRCWPSTRYYFRAIRREDETPYVGIVEQSPALYNKLFGNPRNDSDFGAYGIESAIFSPDDGYDCSYNGNGKDKQQRRYPSLDVARSSSEVGVENWDEQLAELGDLVELMVRMNAVGWETKARAALANTMALSTVNLALAEAGLDLLPVDEWRSHLTEGDN